MVRPDLILGYGSLINPATHTYEFVSEHARVPDWERSWTHRTRHRGQNVTGLTINPRKGATVTGTLLRPQNDAAWQELTQREAGYDLRALPSSHDGQTVGGYQSRTSVAGDTEHPILRSYLDAVLQGVMRFWGNDGLVEFVATTEGWQTPILEDRDDPIYARPVKLTDEERTVFAEILKDVA